VTVEKVFRLVADYLFPDASKDKDMDEVVDLQNSVSGHIFYAFYVWILSSN
jgi:hypothetical protein